MSSVIIGGEPPPKKNPGNPYCLIMPRSCQLDLPSVLAEKSITSEPSLKLLAYKVEGVVVVSIATPIGPPPSKLGSGVMLVQVLPPSVLLSTRRPPEPV